MWEEWKSFGEIRRRDGSVLQDREMGEERDGVEEGCVALRPSREGERVAPEESRESKGREEVQDGANIRYYKTI